MTDIRFGVPNSTVSSTQTTVVGDQFEFVDGVCTAVTAAVGSPYSGSLLTSQGDDFSFSNGLLVSFTQGTCFLSGTKITMSDNTLKNIEDIKIDDEVKGLGTLGNLVDSKVIKIHKINVKKYLIINEKLNVTENHHIFVNEKWIEAKEIKIGDNLLNSKKELCPIFSIEKKEMEEEVSVYHLYLDKFTSHNYFAEDILVHNAKCPFLYSVKENGDLFYENTIIHGIDSKEKECEQVRELKTITNVFVLKEIEQEISYIKDIFLIADGKKIELKSKWNEEYLVLKIGESYKLEFKEIPKETKNLKISANGYYVRKQNESK